MIFKKLLEKGIGSSKSKKCDLPLLPENSDCPYDPNPLLPSSPRGSVCRVQVHQCPHFPCSGLDPVTILQDSRQEPVSLPKITRACLKSWAAENVGCPHRVGMY